MKKMHKALMRTAAVMIGSLLILAGCSQSEDSSAGPNSVRESDAGQSSNKIKIVAAENFYGEVAKAVGGSHVKVTSIITSPSVDPHDFKPTTGTARIVSHAQVVIYNGLGYDDWMKKLISSNGHQKTAIRVGNDVMGKKNGDNEHVWYIPKTMPRLAGSLADKLMKIDPDHAEDYRQNAAAFKKSLQPMIHLVNQLKQSDSREVEVTEPVFDYMLQALNFELNNSDFSLAIEEGTDPDPKDLAQMQNDLENHKVAFLVRNIQVKSPSVAHLVKLAKENNVPIVKVTETLPEGKNYKTWMMGQLKQIQQISERR